MGKKRKRSERWENEKLLRETIKNIQNKRLRSALREFYYEMLRRLRGMRVASTGKLTEWKIAREWAARSIRIHFKNGEEAATEFFFGK
jgi:hypothetical protein